MQLNEIRKTHHKNYPNNRSNKTDNDFENLDDNNREIIGRVSNNKRIESTTKAYNAYKINYIIILLILNNRTTKNIRNRV